MSIAISRIAYVISSTYVQPDPIVVHCIICVWTSPCGDLYVYTGKQQNRVTSTVIFLYSHLTCPSFFSHATLNYWFCDQRIASERVYLYVTDSDVGIRGDIYHDIFTQAPFARHQHKPEEAIIINGYYPISYQDRGADGREFWYQIVLVD